MTLNDRIDGLLNNLRPNRYDVHDLSWMTPIEDTVGSDLTEVEARTIAARTIVARRETQMVRSANKALRLAGDGQEPLAWFAALNLPIVVGDERVRLRAATPADLDQFAQEEGDRAKGDYDTRMLTVKVARRLAAQMRTSDCEQLGLLTPAAVPA